MPRENDEALNPTGGGGGKGGGNEDPTPAIGPDSRSAEIVRRLKDRIARLEENRAMRGDFIAAGETVLSPIERVVDRCRIGDSVTVTTDLGATSTFIDNFEDGDMSEYSDPAGNASITNYPTKELDNAVAITPSSKVWSNSGLPYYPQDGDTFEFYVYIANDGTQASFYFALNSAGDSGYQVRIDPSAVKMELVRIDSGTPTSLDLVNLSSVPTGEYLRAQITWSAGFTVELYDAAGSLLGDATTADPKFTAGGVGYSAAALDTRVSHTAYFDYVRTVNVGALIDDFEDGNISEYSGSTGSATVKNRAELVSGLEPEHGNNALELTGSSTTIYAVQGNLDNDAVAGDTFDVHHYPRIDSQVRHLFGVQDGSNYYYTEADVNADSFALGKVDGGTTTELASTSGGFTVAASKWAQVKIEWGGSGEITARLYDDTGTEIANVTATDTTFTAGGHGWAEIGNATSLHDYALFASPGSQVESGVIDNFEDGDIVEYSGDTGAASTQTSTVYEQSTALDVSKGQNEIVSTSGLPTYPAQGDIFEAYFYVESGEIARFGWGMQDIDNGYVVEVFADNGDYNLYRRDGGTDTGLSAGTMQLSTGKWYRCEVTWQTNGDMTVAFYDPATSSELVSVTVNDSTYTQGGILWGEWATTATVIDSFEDGDLSEYTQTSTSHSPTQAFAYSGSYSMASPSASGIDYILSQPGDGLGAYFQQGDKMEYWNYIDGNSGGGNSGGTGFAWGVTTDSSPEFYAIRVRWGSQDFLVHKYDGTSRGSYFDVTTFNPPTDTWFRTTVEWKQNGDQIVEMYDGNGNVDATQSFNDTSITGGGCGWLTDNGDIDTYVDYALRL